jgi:hypothetical protein
VKRSQGVRLGRPPTLDARTVSRIRRERERGKTLAAIAEGLAADGVARRIAVSGTAQLFGPCSRGKLTSLALRRAIMPPAGIEPAHTV